MFPERENMKSLVSVFYTQDTVYQKMFEDKLLPTMLKYDIDFRMIRTKSKGSWLKNVAEKPKTILDTLNETDRDVVSVDVDATFEKEPILFDNIPEGYDIAFHTLDWNRWYGYSQTPPTMELLTGTMWFKNNDKVKALCKEWYEKAKTSGEWEQVVLSKVIKKHDVKIYPLPIEYCFINSRPRGLEPLVKCDPVIIHYQASRETKKGRI